MLNDVTAKLPLGASIAVNYNEQSKIRQVTISKSSQCECGPAYFTQNKESTLH